MIESVFEATSGQSFLGVVIENLFRNLVYRIIPSVLAQSDGHSVFLYESHVRQDSQVTHRKVVVIAEEGAVLSLTCLVGLRQAWNL